MEMIGVLVGDDGTSGRYVSDGVVVGDTHGGDWK
jgi:hypothetical protein